MPVTAQRLLALMNGEDVSLARIAELVEFDQAIAAAVLRMARSRAYAGSRPPETVRDAVLRLGTVPLLNMVLGDYLTRIKTSAPLYDLSEDDLWAHAAAAQLAVRAITQECPGAQLPAVTSTAALLHDIGKLVMSRCLNASVETIVSHARQAGITFVEAERQLFGVDHAPWAPRSRSSGTSPRRSPTPSRATTIGSSDPRPRSSMRSSSPTWSPRHRRRPRRRGVQPDRGQRMRPPARPGLHEIRSHLPADRYLAARTP